MILLLGLFSCTPKFRGIFYTYEDDVYGGVITAELLDPSIVFPQPYEDGPKRKVDSTMVFPQKSIYNNLVTKEVIYDINDVKDEKKKKKKGKKSGLLRFLGKKKKKSGDNTESEEAAIQDEKKEKRKSKKRGIFKKKKKK